MNIVSKPEGKTTEKEIRRRVCGRWEADSFVFIQNQ